MRAGVRSSIRCGSERVSPTPAMAMSMSAPSRLPWTELEMAMGSAASRLPVDGSAKRSAAGATGSGTSTGDAGGERAQDAERFVVRDVRAVDRAHLPARAAAPRP